MTFKVQVRQDAFANALNISSVREKSGDSQLAISQVVAASTTDQEILAAIDISQLKAFMLKSDVAVTVKTNSSGSPVNTFTLLAGVPYAWVEDDYNALLLTADVTRFFITNATANPANVQILALVDLP